MKGLVGGPLLVGAWAPLKSGPELCNDLPLNLHRDTQASSGNH